MDPSKDPTYHYIQMEKFFVGLTKVPYAHIYTEK